MEQFLKERGVTVVTLDRDPRDMCVSAIFHMHKFGKGLIEGSWFRDLTLDEQLELTLTGTDWYNSVYYIYRAFKGWRTSRMGHTVNFAYLLGPWGSGGTESQQLTQLRKLAQVLQAEKSDKELIDIFYKVYATGYTFHQGKVGMWKRYFTEKYEEIFKDLMRGIEHESDDL